MKKNTMILIVSLFEIILFIGFFMYFNYLYPLKYLDIINKYSSEFNLENNLVLGVVNSESGFNEKARSKSDALGLMQLKFKTAEEIATKLNIENFKEEDLFNPEINIRFGCFYLRYLIDYYNGNVNLAICAYNAGFTNVNKWLNDENYIKDGEILSLPFAETEKYLKNILSSQKIYKNYYGIR